MRSIKFKIVFLSSLFCIVFSMIILELSIQSANFIFADHIKGTLIIENTYSSEHLENVIDEEISRLKSLYVNILAENIYKTNEFFLTKIKNNILLEDYDYVGLTKNLNEILFTDGKNVQRAKLLNKDLFKKSSENIGYLTEKPLFDYSNISEGLSYIIPIKIENNDVVYVIATRSTNYVKRLIKFFSFLHTEKLLVINEDGFSVLKNDYLNNRSLFDDVELSDLNDDKIYFGNIDLFENFSDHKVYLKLNTIKKTNWYILHILSEDDISMNLRSIRIKVLLWGFPFILLCLVLIYLLANLVSNPIMHLSILAQEITKGNFNFLVPEKILKKNDEIGHLAIAFNTMRVELDHLVSEVKHLAYFDSLTEIPVRQYFLEKMDAAIEQTAQNKGKLAVVFLDLDNFKEVNDNFGHLVGDKLLIHFANRLKSLVKPSDMISRFGGDEFNILLNNIKDKTEIVAIIKRIEDSMSRIFDIDGHQLNVGMSIGLAVFPEDGESREILLERADYAMYETKHRGKNGYSFFKE